MSTLNLADLIDDNNTTPTINVLENMDTLTETTTEGDMMKLEQKQNVTIDTKEINTNDKEVDNVKVDINTNTKKKDIVKTPKVNKIKTPIKRENIDGAMSVFDYLTKNKDKIENCKLINLNISSVPAGKYMLFVSNEEKDASLHKLDHTNVNAFYKPSDAKCINIFNSGVIIETINQRMYITKTNTFVYQLDDKKIPTSLITMTKIFKPQTETKANKKVIEVEMIKLLLKKDAITLYPKIKDLNSLKDIVDEILNFKKDISDVLYQLKLENMLMCIDI